MQPTPPRPATTARASTRRPGAAAPWLLLAILSANHSAARAAPASLPYLAQIPPAPLRIGAPPPRHPAPPPLAPPASDPAAPEIAAADPRSEADAGGAPGPALALPADTPEPSASQPGPASPAPILPDAYATPPPVTVHDLLPYFLPSTRPLSRATYEVK